jgi:hypothetical protein
MLSVTIWDVQHGSAAYIKTPDGRHVVIDLGVGDITSRDAEFSPLLQLRASGVTQLDEVIITHPHRDHLDDVYNFDLLSPRVLRRSIGHLSEAQIRGGNKPGDNLVLDKFFEIHRRYSGVVGPGANPEDPANNGGATIACFDPVRSPAANLNNHSTVTFVENAGSVICLPGDNESASWMELLENLAFRQWLGATQILVAPHHGREAGYCEDVFKYCRPCLVVVSDGPASDTSAVEKYRGKASGWPVRSRSSGAEERRSVLTTHNDGTVRVRAFQAGATSYLLVDVE